jgi:SAM-dependent methyltransferase
MDTGQLYELFMGSADTGRVVAFLEWLLRRYGSGERPRVLDVGAGTGRLLAPLAALGWDVLGLEPRESYRLRHPDIRPGGFAEIDQHGTFDAVLAVNDPFWYLLSDGERRDALERTYRALRPGGLVFLDGPNFGWILENYRAPTPTEKNGVRRTPSVSFDLQKGVWSHYDTFEADGKVVRDEHHFAILTFEQIEDLLRSSGFEQLETFTSWSSRASERPDGARMMVAARKPSTTSA